MYRIITAIAAAATVVAAPAFASDPTTRTAKPAAEKKYCVEPAHTTGRLLVKKTCLTRAQWIAKTGVDPETVK